MVARLVRNEKVRGSNPLSSTTKTPSPTCGNGVFLISGRPDADQVGSDEADASAKTRDVKAKIDERGDQIDADMAAADADFDAADAIGVAEWAVEVATRAAPCAHVG